MTKTDGIEDLVKTVQKEIPIAKAKNTEEMWEKFLRIVFVGGGRGDAEISFILKVLKNETSYDFVLKTRGEAWQEAVLSQLDLKMKKEKDERKLQALESVKKEIWRLTASIKGSARYFERTKMSPDVLEKMCKDKDSSWEFIEELADDEDVTNIKFTKIIIWLHSVGFAQDFCPPSRQVKDFINKDLELRYQFYEDDKFFMQKLQEFALKFSSSTVYDVSKAIFFFRTLKSMLNNRSTEYRKFTPDAMMGFMKRNNFSLKDINELLSDFDMRDGLPEQLHKFMSRRR